MFVFKAAVVGAGVMGGEIAQVIAAADIPVILKDVDQRFVDTGLEKAREVTAGQAAKLVEKGKLTQEQGDAHVRRILANVSGARCLSSYSSESLTVTVSGPGVNSTRCVPRSRLSSTASVWPSRGS